MQDLQEAANELEDWKAKQKRIFNEQLKKLESHHLQTLSDEWKKRERGREESQAGRLADVTRLETELRKAISSVEQQQKAIDEKVRANEALETKLKEQEAKVKKIGISGGGGQQVQKRLDELKTTHRAEVDELLAKVHRLESDAATGRMNEAEERGRNEAEKAQLQTQLQQALKSKLGYKHAWQLAEEKIASLAAEKDREQQNRLNEAKAEIERLRAQVAEGTARPPPPTDAADGAGANSAASATESLERDDAGIAVSDRDARRQIFRLQQQKATLLKTGDYSANDDIVKSIERRMKELQ